MERKILALTAACLIALAGGVAWFLAKPSQPRKGQKIPAKGLKLTSPAFDNGGKIPKEYTFDGPDISPPLSITGADGETLVVVMDDPDAPGGVFTHWLIWNIPADTGRIPKGIPQEETVERLGGAVQGKNDFGEVGYGGPKPPKGEKHEYRIFLYTLDKELELEPKSNSEELVGAIRGHILQKTKITGFYKR